MRTLRCAFILLLLGTAHAAAQSVPSISAVVGSCGSANYVAGQNRVDTQTPGGNRCVSGTVAVTASPAPTTDAPGTIASGGTFQQIAAADTSRKSLDFINICSIAGNCTNTSDNCYLSFSNSPSLTTAIPLPAGAEYLRTSGSVPSDAIQATCDSAGDHYFLNIQ